MSRLENPFTLLKESALPITGIYFLFNYNELVYIGQSTDIIQRIQQHKQDKAFTDYAYVRTSKRALLEIESAYIKKHNPKLNIVHRKKEFSFPYELDNDDFRHWYSLLNTNSCGFYNNFFAANLDGEMVISFCARRVDRRGRFSFKFKSIKGDVICDGSAIPKRGWFKHGRKTAYFDVAKGTIETMDTLDPNS